MRILIVAVHFEVTGARYITDAFKRLGHDVRHVGPAARLKDAWGVDVDKKYEWVPDDAHKAKWIPDLIIIADTLINWRPQWDWLNVPVVYWVQDNHVRNVRRAGIDHYFLAHFHGPAQPVSQTDETWLPCATDATLFTPSPIPFDQRTFDVALIGVMYPRRAKLVQMLREAGFSVLAETGLVYDDYRDAYHNARISLCVSAAGDVAQRVFETAGMGCHVMTDPLLDLSGEQTNKALGLAGFSVWGAFEQGDGEPLEHYQQRQDEECIERVRDVLTTAREQCKAVTEYMQRTVLQQHTWDKRAEVVVEWFEQNYYIKNGTVYNRKQQAYEQQLTELAATGKADQLTENFFEKATLPEGATIKRSTHLNGNSPRDTQNTKPFLNLGCGTTHLPGAPPPGHELVDLAVYEHPLWLNVDKVEGVGADKTFDLFRYPWPLEDDSYDGALLCHICEHIPHEINPNASFWEDWVLQEKDHNLAALFGGQKENALDRWTKLAQLQDGWYAFFSELYRVLTPGALVHIVSPYGHSDGGITDPTHTRYLTINTFSHSMTPSVGDGPTFKYNNGGINFVLQDDPRYRVTPMFQHLVPQETDLPQMVEAKKAQFQQELMTRINVIYDFRVVLKCVK